MEDTEEVFYESIRKLSPWADYRLNINIIHFWPFQPLRILILLFVHIQLL